MTRAKLTREFYKPKGTTYTVKDVAAEFVVYTNAKGETVIAAFGGKRSKPDWHYRFSTKEQAMKKVDEWLEGLRFRAASKKEWREKMNKPHTLKVGHILKSSWGYDQTNVDFYEVVELVGKTMVMIRPIAATDVSSSDDPHDRLIPMPGKFTGDAIKKKAYADGHISLNSYSNAYVWNGKPAYQTGWSYGH